MRAWFFSDLHLLDSQSALYPKLIEVLKQPSGPEDHVIFAGDIFDLLVGDSTFFQKKFCAFFTAVEELLKRSVQVHYIEGNHDFHLRSLFSRSVRFEEESIVLQGKATHGNFKLYVAHGDLVDQHDIQYLRLRKIVRSGPVAFLSKVLPGQWIEKVGLSLSRPESRKSAELPEHWPAEDRERLRKVFRTFAKEKNDQGFDHVILGHCHDLDEVAPYYWNMGFPPVHRKYLYFDSSFPPESRVSRRTF